MGSSLLTKLFLGCRNSMFFPVFPIHSSLPQSDKQHKDPFFLHLLWKP